MYPLGRVYLRSRAAHTGSRSRPTKEWNVVSIEFLFYLDLLFLSFLARREMQRNDVMAWPYRNLKGSLACACAWGCLGQGSHWHGSLIMSAGEEKI